MSGEATRAFRLPASSLTLIASRLAPTGMCVDQAFGEPMPWPICTAVPAVISSAHFT